MKRPVLLGFLLGIGYGLLAFGIGWLGATLR